MTSTDPELAQLLRAGVLLCGDGDRDARSASIELDAGGGVAAIASATEPALVLSSPLVDLHSNVVDRRRRPRPGVEAPLPLVLGSLDAELAAAGVGTACATVGFEQRPERRPAIDEALELCIAIEQLAPSLSCDWRIHARVEVTEPDAPDGLRAALDLTSRIALVSLVHHSPERSRFPTAADQIAFYASDWGVGSDLVAQVLERRSRGAEGAETRSRAVAALAREHDLPLASHDDRDPADVRAARELGATICEFPLTLEAARAARELGMGVVLGAAGALLGRSTSPIGFTAAIALAAAACDALCSDYLPGSLLHAPFALAARGLPIDRALATVTAAPRRLLRHQPQPIAVGVPLSAALLDPRPGRSRAVAVWRDGALVHRTATRDI